MLEEETEVRHSMHDFRRKGEMKLTGGEDNDYGSKNEEENLRMGSRVHGRVCFKEET